MRTVNFYGSPITKLIIVLVSVLSFLNVFIRLSFARNHVGVYLTSLFTVPLGSQLVICLTVFYQTRLLEKCFGSYNHMHFIVSSVLVSVSILVSLRFSIVSNPLPLGCLVYVLFSIMVTMAILRLRATHIRHILGVQLTSHVLLIAATGLLLLLSSSGIFSSLFAGALGAYTIHWTGLIPLPHSLMNIIVNTIIQLFKEKPPQLLSGATLNVQRQQRMDLIEGYILNFQQGTDRQLTRGGQYIPTNEQIQQLSQMGFRPEECRQALAAANGNIGFAIQLLTTNRPE